MDPASFFWQLAEQFRSQTLLDWAITFTALAYVVLAARENTWCWAWGILSAGLWAYADFACYNLWVDGLLQVFYLVMGVWGWFSWKRGPDKAGELPVSSLSLRSHLPFVLAGLAFTFVLGFVFKSWTPTSFPFADAFITSFSILATWLTIRKVLESWLYWIFFDALAIGLFWAKDALLVAVVMLVYTGFAIFGYFNWRKSLLPNG